MIEIAEASGVVSKQQIEMLRESIKAMEAEIGSINADDQLEKRKSNRISHEGILKC